MKIAVIGSGISGLTSAYLLSESHDVTVFEANDYIGGHTHTIDVPLDGKVYPVDTGFIVFNLKTYPNFVKLLGRLGVTWQDSNMSFSVQCARTGIEFSPTSLNALFCQRKNLFNPSFYRMLSDVFRFRREARELLKGDDDQITLDQYLTQNRYSKAFIDHFIIPMGDSIWSADPRHFREFPARLFVEFFENHGILNIKNQPGWLVIKGGSKQYIEPITRRFRNNIRLLCPVESVTRLDDGVTVQVRGQAPETFDKVIIAAHSHQALAMLADPTDQEQEILGNIRYQDNDAILHTDTALLPRRKVAWASWNYHVPKEDLGRVALTYNMNILQSLGASREFCVTLNLASAVDRAKVIREIPYDHPVYDPVSLAARKRRQEINGQNHTYFCGAYWYYGFHEDGVRSALDICREFGNTL
jgi:predicted NAD/FAD-binding protein